MEHKDWLLRQATAPSRNGWDKAALLAIWLVVRSVWFLARSLWHQHITGPWRWYINTVFLACVVAGYFYLQNTDIKKYGLIFMVGVSTFATVQYAIFCIRRKRVEANVAAVFAGACGTQTEDITARVRRWDGWQPKEIRASIPQKVTRSALTDLETQIRQRLIAPPGCDWHCCWDLKRHRVGLMVVPELPEIVLYRDAVRSQRFAWNKFVLGVGRSGLVVWDCLHVPHLLVAGTTGGGKSVTLLVLLLRALRRPGVWRIFAVDLKRVEFSYLHGRRNVVGFAADLDSAFVVIEKVLSIMNTRYRKMEEVGVNHFLKMPKRPTSVLLAIDEFAELAATSGLKAKQGKEEDELRAACIVMIQSIARLGRAAGVFLVLATQRPDAAILPGGLKVNVEGRLAVGRLNPVSSEMVLEDRAAAELPDIKGRGLWRTPEGLEEVQVLYADVEDVDRYRPTEQKTSE